MLLRWLVHHHLRHFAHIPPPRKRRSAPQLVVFRRRPPTEYAPQCPSHSASSLPSTHRLCASIAAMAHCQQMAELDMVSLRSSAHAVPFPVRASGVPRRTNPQFSRPAVEVPALQCAPPHGHGPEDTALHVVSDTRPGTRVPHSAGYSGRESVIVSATQATGAPGPLGTGARLCGQRGVEWPSPQSSPPVALRPLAVRGTWGPAACTVGVGPRIPPPRLAARAAEGGGGAAVGTARWGDREDGGTGEATLRMERAGAPTPALPSTRRSQRTWGGAAGVLAKERCHGGPRIDRGSTPDRS